MTTYAYDTSTNQLVAVWDTGIGATARTVARLHARTGVTVAMNLAEALTRMSKSAWLSYTEPELVDLPVAAARRALRRPNLPQDDLLRIDEHPVVESAHRVGRELREVGSAGVSRAVIADVEQEMAAVEDAGRGDLTGRAQQAVMLTRVMPSPAQIAVADRLLHEVPMGSPRLYTEVEPSAAGIAAIHWFLSAVAVVARHADISETDALAEAERVQYFDPQRRGPCSGSWPPPTRTARPSPSAGTCSRLRCSKPEGWCWLHTTPNRTSRTSPCSTRPGPPGASSTGSSARSRRWARCTPPTWTVASGPRGRESASTRRCGRRQRRGLRSGCRSWWGPTHDGYRWSPPAADHDRDNVGNRVVREKIWPLHAWCHARSAERECPAPVGIASAEDRVLARVSRPADRSAPLGVRERLAGPDAVRSVPASA